MGIVLAVNYPAQIEDFDGECAQTTYSTERPYPSTPIMLRSSVYNDEFDTDVWEIYPDFIAPQGVYQKAIVRPALTVDLSKINWEIVP